MQKKYATWLVQELKTIVPLYLVCGLKNNTVFSECVCAHSSDYVIFTRSTGCAVRN